MAIQITLTIVFAGVLVFAAHLFAEFFRIKKLPNVLLLIIIGLAIFDFDPICAFMLGAFWGGIASAIVIPMVGQLNLQSDSKTILILEAAVSDVLCVVAGLTFFGALKLGELRFGIMPGSIIAGFSFFAIIGVLGGFGWLFLLNNRFEAIGRTYRYFMKT